MSSLLFERSSDDRLIAGVCGGIAARLAVDATLVRLVFAILALAGGAGILVYLALWVYARGRRALPAAILLAAAAAAILSALGLSGTELIGSTLLVAGLVTMLAAGGCTAAASPTRKASSRRSRTRRQTWRSFMACRWSSRARVTPGSTTARASSCSRRARR